MAGQLDGIGEKISRAIEQFHGLDAEIRVWLERDPVPIVHQRNAEGWNVISMQPLALPLRWAVILGEIVHDLRSALDQLIWQLVLANHETPTRGNQFPIFSEGWAPGWTKKDWKQRAATWASYLRGVHPADITLIKSAQPYKRRHRLRLVPLEVLAQLSNTDKHQTLPPVATITVPWERRTVRFVDGLPDGVTVEEVSVPSPGLHLVAHETYLIAVRLNPPDAQVKMEMEQPILVSVAFGEGGQLPLGNVLDLIAESLRIVGMFLPRFP